MLKLKFRAWDTENSKMIYPENNYKGQSSFVVSPTGTVLIATGHDGYDNIFYGTWVTEYKTFTQIECVPMQFTGFKDTNGRDIYKGDIVKYSEYESRHGKVWELSEHIGAVDIEKFDFEDGHDVISWGFDGTCLSSVCFGIEHDIKKMRDNKRDFAYRDWGSYMVKDMKLEIIGNIYENPELLNL